MSGPARRRCRTSHSFSCLLAAYARKEPSRPFLICAHTFLQLIRLSSFLAFTGQPRSHGATVTATRTARNLAASRKPTSAVVRTRAGGTCPAAVTNTRHTTRLIASEARVLQASVFAFRCQRRCAVARVLLVSLRIDDAEATDNASLTCSRPSKAACGCAAFFFSRATGMRVAALRVILHAPSWQDARGSERVAYELGAF